MTTFLALTIAGLVVGCIYALTATGLVVTYITSGIFNFAHGAVGMVAAFAYWQLTVEWGWPAPLALVAVLFVLAPLLGALIERVLMRRVHGQPVEVSLVITLGLLLFLIGVAYTLWSPSVARVLPLFFSGHTVRMFSVTVTWHQLLVAVVAAAVAVGLRLYLFRTRSGTALRAVVDDPGLTALTGASPGRLGQLGWVIGSVLAALAGIMLAPLVTLDVLTLTLLVINGYAAAMVGRLRNLPLTFAGGVVLGLFESYAVGYLPGGLLSRVKPTLPIIFLFLVLLLLPDRRLRVGRPPARLGGTNTSLRKALVTAAVFVAAAWVVSGFLGGTDLTTATKGIVLSVVMLSLVPLTGFSGQISLCQLTFVGFGAFAMGKVAGGGSWFGVVAAVLFAGVAGALVALPALRLKGLYLALSTLAFAQAMTAVFFNNNAVFGQGGALHVGRLGFPGISLDGHRSYFVFTAVVFALLGIGVTMLRGSVFGRRLAGMADSPMACVTLGMSLTRTKLAVFTLSASIAGLAGVLYGGVQGSVGSADFEMLQSLVILLLAVIWGVDSVVGVLFAGLLYALFPVIQQNLIHVRTLAFLGTGIGAIGLGSHPEGVVRQTKAQVEATLRRLRRQPAPTEIAGAGAGADSVPVPASVVASVRSGPRPVDAPAPALELLGIRAAYGRIEVVHGVDLVVPPASVFAVLGPNGAGKSTLLKVAAGQVQPTAGHVHVDGVHVNGMPPEALARVGVCTIPEGRGVFANLTVSENLRMDTFAAGARGHDVEDEAFTRFPRLRDKREQLAGTLSGGEQQMLSMARAVVTHPSVLLLDEISMGLAPIIVGELYELVGQLARDGIAILVVEQFARHALAVADYVAVMAQGRIERVGEPADVADTMTDAYLKGVA
jgi:branched-chain amino acid transport system permease protein